MITNMIFLSFPSKRLRLQCKYLRIYQVEIRVKIQNCYSTPSPSLRLKTKTSQSWGKRINTPTSGALWSFLNIYLFRLLSMPAIYIPQSTPHTSFILQKQSCPLQIIGQQEHLWQGHGERLGLPWKVSPVTVLKFREHCVSWFWYRELLKRELVSGCLLLGICLGSTLSSQHSAQEVFHRWAGIHFISSGLRMMSM